MSGSLARTIKRGKIAAVFLCVYAIGYSLLLLIMVFAAIDAAAQLFPTILLFLLAGTPFWAFSVLSLASRQLEQTGAINLQTRLFASCMIMIAPLIVWGLVSYETFFPGRSYGEPMMHYIWITIVAAVLVWMPAVLSGYLVWIFARLRFGWGSSDD